MIIVLCQVPRRPNHIRELRHHPGTLWGIKRLSIVSMGLRLSWNTKCGIRQCPCKKRRTCYPVTRYSAKCQESWKLHRGLKNFLGHPFYLDIVGLKRTWDLVESFLQTVNNKVRYSISSILVKYLGKFIGALQT